MLTVGEMLGLTKRFHEIQNCDSRVKDVRLANLMTDMEQAYDIPCLRNDEYNKKNPHVIAMYRAVSEARAQSRLHQISV